MINSYTSWYLREQARRLLDSRPPASVLLSFPRSGSHLLRYLIEFCTERPTLGSAEHFRKLVHWYPADSPVFLRAPGIRISNLKPILARTHETFNLESYSRLILLRRDPIEALLSDGRDFQDDEFLSRLPRRLDMYRNIENAFSRWAPEDRLAVDYERLIANPAGSVSQVLKFLRQEEKTTISSVQVQAALLALPRAPLASERAYRQLFPARAHFVETALSADPDLGL